MIRRALIVAVLAATPVLAQTEGGTLVIPGDDPALDWLFDERTDPETGLPRTDPLGDPLAAPAPDPDQPSIQVEGDAVLITRSRPQAAPREAVESAAGAMLRGLDKVSGETSEIDIATGQTVAFGRLTVTLGDCRYPVEDPSSNAYAQLSITDTVQKAVVFDGWMISSSPALSALDHSRYDVWVIRCNVPQTEQEGG